MLKLVTDYLNYLDDINYNLDSLYENKPLPLHKAECDICEETYPLTYKYWTVKAIDYIQKGGEFDWLCKECFHREKRQYHESLRLPRWADRKKIQDIYDNCPTGYEVDHIIPRRGRNVCGLHVENNLQYLTKKENRRKKNKYENNS
jgi:hypothetical protein